MDKKISYSKEGELNRILLFSTCNDIIVVVEDKDKEYEYEAIFSRLLKNNYNINRFGFIGVGGKPQVEKAFSDYKRKINNIPILYIVDGDFDILIDKNIIQDDNYIYLDKYNIESYYIDKKATLNFLRGKLHKRENDINDIIEYDKWESDTYQKLTPLFLGYLVAQKICPTKKNVGLSQYQYIRKDGFIDESKINDYLNNIKKEKDFDITLSYYQQQFDLVLKGDKTKLICGKYILTSLSIYLRNFAQNITFKNDDFKYSLITNFDIEKLSFLKLKIENILPKNLQ